MKHTHIKLLILLLLATTAATASKTTRWKKAVKCADKKAQKKYYASAAEAYERIAGAKWSQDSAWRDSLYSVKVKLANTYMKTGNTIKAEANYAEVVNAAKADANTIFSYARALQANGKYVEAKEQFEKIAEDPAGKSRMAKGFAEISDKAENSKHKNAFNIERAPFNTSATEYAPAYYKKGLAYTSNRAERGQPAQSIMWNKEAFTAIYTVQEDGKGDLNITDKLPNTINSKLNDGAASFNKAFDEVFFTRNNKKCKKHDQLQIFTSTFNGTDWSTPKLLNFEMEGANYAHPALSPDGNTLYFSSDVQGSGIGGMDIYTAHRNGSVWETPVNLGASVNTADNETFPYLAADSTLYFTSDGWPGYGGMDIFHTKKAGNSYSKVRNMGADFNTHKDDLSLIIDSKNKIGFFASNRDGDDDIFSFSLPVSKDDKKDEPLYNLTLIDKSTNQPVPNARIEVADPRNPGEGAFYYTNDKGIFYYDKKIKTTDDVKISRDNYKPQTMKGAALTNVSELDLAMEKEAPAAVKEDIHHPYTTILYYDLNTSILSASDKDTLREVVNMMKNPNNLVYVSGYADQHGSDTYNNGISLRRVKDVVDYLASQGIETIRIRSAYFGSVKLSKDCLKDPKCVENTNSRNRRVEIKVSNQ